MYIAGGWSVEEGEFPSFVTLVDGYPPFRIAPDFCSAVAIRGDLILTAAHCFEGYEGPIYATASIHHPNQYQGKDIKFTRVSKVCRTPSYEMLPSGQLHHDYSVLRLVEPIEGIKPALLNRKPVGPRTEAIAVGMGRNGIDSMPKSLQALDVEVVKCGEADFHKTTICTRGTLDGQTCGGDSGGPVYVKAGTREVVIGLTSYGENTCFVGDRTSLDVNAEIAKNLGEIKQLIKDCTVV